MNMIEIGVTIRCARKDARLTQQQVAEMLGMSRATISGIETGRIAEVGIRKMAALCGVLDLESLWENVGPDLAGIEEGATWKITRLASSFQECTAGCFPAVPSKSRLICSPTMLPVPANMPCP